MNINTKLYYYLIIIIPMMSSCLNLNDESKNWLENDKEKESSGKYHFLEDNGTKVYLPNDFERCSLTKYQSLLDSLSTKKEYKFEIERLNSLSEMDGSLYIFFDKNTRSTYTINTAPHLTFTKDNASQLLGLIRSNNDQVSKNTGATFTKVTAKYGGNTNQQLFKAIYKVGRKSLSNAIFNSSYIISSNDKTVFIQLTTALEVDFDPFIEKMLL